MCKREKGVRIEVLWFCYQSVFCEFALGIFSPCRKIVGAGVGISLPLDWSGTAKS